jgi:hypothetical protein
MESSTFARKIAARDVGGDQGAVRTSATSPRTSIWT